MHKWRIIGAEAATGEERSIEVNARDEPGAREAARMLGMLVAHVERLATPTGPVLPYRTPGLSNRAASVAMATVAAADDPSAPPAVPYASILSGATAAIGVARFLSGFGVIAVMLAVAAVIGAVVVAINPADRVYMPLLLLLALAAGLVGLALIAAAVALQLLAAIGLAIRDMAGRTPPNPPVAAPTLPQGGQAGPTNPAS